MQIILIGISLFSKWGMPGTYIKENKTTYTDSSLTYVKPSIDSVNEGINYGVNTINSLFDGNS